MREKRCNIYFENPFYTHQKTRMLWNAIRVALPSKFANPPWYPHPSSPPALLCDFHTFLSNLNELLRHSIMVCFN